MKHLLIQCVISLSLISINTHGMACCRSQGVELDDETVERNQQLVERLNNEDANRYVIDLQAGKTTQILRFSTRSERKFWTLKTDLNGDQIISIENHPIIEGYQNNDQILCHRWKITGLKKGTSPIIFQERKSSKVISQLQKTITVIE